MTALFLCATSVAVARSERRHGTAGSVKPVTSDAARVVGEQVNRDRWRRRCGLDVMNVVERRQQRVELAVFDGLLTRDFECRLRFSPAIIDASIHGFIQNAAIDADQTPREMIVNWRLRARR